MALPDSRFVACFPLQGYFVDKDTGFPLAAGVVTFYEDENRTVLKKIYQQVQLTDNTYQFVELDNPVILTSVGTWGNEDGDDIMVFLYPYEGLPADATTGSIELYYITVESSGLVPQFTREAWPPGLMGGTNPTDTFSDSDNQIANPQFVEVLFSPVNTHVFTVSGAATRTTIAPNWDILTDGSGTVTVKQIAVSDVDMPSNAPFALDIASTGITSLQLVQRLEESPRLFSSGFVNGSLVAKTIGSATPTPLIMNYVPSTGALTELVNGSTAADGSFTALSGTATIANTNTDPGNTGYVDIAIVIPVDVEIQISSIQIVSVQNILSSSPFIQQSTARQIDHLFHYYKPQLEYKPIPSHLVAWDFPLNPVQFLGSTVAASAIGANKSKYVWDQTIIFQSADSGVGVTRGTAGELLLTAAATTKMAVVQYLDQTRAREILNQPIAVNIAAKTSAAAGITANVSLWYTVDATLPDINAGTNNSIVLTLDANGIPATTNGTWTKVPRILGDAVFTIGTNATTDFNDYNFSGWDLQNAAAANTATFFAIVIGTASVTAADTIGIYSVGMNSGDIATRPAPQSANQVLQDCGYFYEKTYDNGVTPGAASLLGALTFEQFTLPFTGSTAAAVLGLIPRTFGFKFSYPKRNSSPVVAVYNPVDGSINQVEGIVYNGGVVYFTDTVAISNWAATSLGQKAITFVSANITQRVTAGAVVGNNSEAWISLHATIDSRLGIV